MSNSKMIANAISAVLALSTGSQALADISNHPMGNPVNDMERCYGIVKSGHNDCATASHGCAGEAKIDASKTEWIFVPTGLCQKIVGGSKT